MTFTESEQIHLWRLARKRHEPKRRRGIKGPWSRQPSVNTHYEGLRAEYAVAKLFNIPLDESISLSGDDGTDLTLPDGRTVQVKYRGRRGWDYALPSANPEDFTTDIGILVWPCEDPDDTEDVDVVGWVTRDLFCGLASEVNYFGKPGGERLALGSALMSSIESLLEEVAGDKAA